MHDIFFRKDNFKGEPWYNNLCIFCAIGVCQPENKEYIEPLQEALSVLGYSTRIRTHEGKDYIMGD